MRKNDKQTIKDIESILKKRKEVIKTEASQTEPSTEGLAEEVVFKLLQQLNKAGPIAGPIAGPGSAAPAAGSHTELKEAEKRFKMATMMIKLSKNISILCILVFILPFITILVTMMDQEMAALMISMGAMIYPAWLFAQSLGLQKYLSSKYGLKPLLRMPTQQQQIMPAQNQPNPQQKKRNQEFF